MNHDQTTNNVYITTEQLNRWLTYYVDGDYVDDCMVDATNYQAMAEDIHNAMCENFTMKDGDLIIDEDEVRIAVSAGVDYGYFNVDTATKELNKTIHLRLFG